MEGGGLLFLLIFVLLGGAGGGGGGGGLNRLGIMIVLLVLRDWEFLFLLWCRRDLFGGRGERVGGCVSV